HGEERAHLACDEGPKEALLLLLGAVEVKNLGVPGVGRLTAEDQLREVTASYLLVEVRVLEEAAARATRLRRQVRGPEAGILGVLLQLVDERVGGLVLPHERLLVRIDVLLHERAHAFALVLHSGDDRRHARGASGGARAYLRARVAAGRRFEGGVGGGRRRAAVAHPPRRRRCHPPAHALAPA